MDYENPAVDIPGLNQGDYAIVTGYPHLLAWRYPHLLAWPKHDPNGRVVQLRGAQGPGHQRSFVLVTNIAKEGEDPEYYSHHLSFHAKWLRPVEAIEALGSLASAAR